LSKNHPARRIVPPGGTHVAQVLAVLATAAAAVFTVVVLGIYLFVRFTQHRKPPPGT
jgi:hypothetical protein